MHILLTNDDGVRSAGLASMAAACQDRGHSVVIVAPAEQQSAASQRITISSPLLVRSVPWEGADAFAVQGTPSDCVRLAGQLSDRPVDFVFSGINDGWNASGAVYYSGTVAAAREARMCGLKSVAVSIDVGATEEMRLHLAYLALDLAEKLQPLEWPRMSLLSLNAPALPPVRLKPTVYAPLSNAYFHEQYERRISPRNQCYFWLGKGIGMEPHLPGTDMDLLEKGHVTLSLLGGWQDDSAWLQQTLGQIPPNEPDQGPV